MKYLCTLFLLLSATFVFAAETVTKTNKLDIRNNANASLYITAKPSLTDPWLVLDGTYATVDSTTMDPIKIITRNNTADGVGIRFRNEYFVSGAYGVNSHARIAWGKDGDSAVILKNFYDNNNCSGIFTYCGDWTSVVFKIRYGSLGAQEAFFFEYPSFYPGADNGTSLGLSNKRWSAVYAANGTIQTSDATQKTDIKVIKNVGSFIRNLRPVTYRWKEGAGDKIVHAGFLAQEVEIETKRQSDANGTDLSGIVDKSGSLYGMRYTEIIPPLVAAVQELQAKNEELEGRLVAVRDLQSKNAELESRLVALEKKMAQLQKPQ